MPKKKKKWDDKVEGKKPWEHGYKSPPKPTKKKKAAAGPTPGVGSMAEDVHNELVKRNKKFAPYAETGPGAPKKKKKRK